MSDFHEEDFIPKGKEKFDQINKTLQKVLDTVNGEWISHIDKNILGKIKLSSNDFSLVRKGV
jgi:F0F1-type ATP synthase delta subunit